MGNNPGKLIALCIDAGSKLRGRFGRVDDQSTSGSHDYFACFPVEFPYEKNGVAERIFIQGNPTIDKVSKDKGFEFYRIAKPGDEVYDSLMKRALEIDSSNKCRTALDFWHTWDHKGNPETSNYI